MINADVLKTELDAYVQRIRKIRLLSVAHPSGVGTGEGYSRELQAAFAAAIILHFFISFFIGSVHSHFSPFMY